MIQVKIEETDASDWFYFSEGGKHAIFRYRGAEISLSGHLLRVAKSNLARFGDSTTTTSTRIATTAPKITVASALILPSIDFSDDSPCQQFQRQIIQPLLCHCYLDLARTVCVTAQWCAQLYHRTLASGLIPVSRLSSWKLDFVKQDASINVNFNNVVNALLLRDYTHLLRQPLSPTAGHNTPPSYSVVFSVEIKPKAGYTSSSPLVLPANRCKYYRTRYSLQQELMQMGQVHKGWRTSTTRIRVAEGSEQRKQHQSTKDSNSMRDEPFTPSNYSPSDLFSGNVIRMQKALVDMSCNMQNNFRVWCNGNQLFGEDTSSPTDSDCQAILQDMFHCFGQDHSIDNDAWDRQNIFMDSKAKLLDVIVTTATKILKRESSLLSNMLSIQQLDWIDGDGAVIIYERLVRLCKGSNSEAEALLDAAVLTPDDTFSLKWKEGASLDMNDLRSRHDAVSPYTLPKCNALQQLLEEIQHFQSYLHAKLQNCDSSVNQAFDVSHVKCIEYVNQLSKQACIYLLQNWLLSLSLCDVSFFITFQHMKECSSAADNELNDVRQTCEHGGTFVCPMQSYNGGGSTSSTSKYAVAVHYEVKVIDCDPKPAKKLRRRREVENAFQFVA